MVTGRGRRREHLIYENKRGQFPMVIGRGRRREHLIYENKRGGSFLWSQDADVVEDTPTNILYYYLEKRTEKKYGEKKYIKKNTGKEYG